jgi:hypothetical protein
VRRIQPFRGLLQRKIQYTTRRPRLGVHVHDRLELVRVQGVFFVVRRVFVSENIHCQSVVPEERLSVYRRYALESSTEPIVQMRLKLERAE